MAVQLVKLTLVEQVPKEADENEVHALFEPFGEIVEFHVSRKGNGSAGCAFIKYNLWAEAEMAMEHLHGKHSMTGAKNPLVVKFADAKNKESNDSQVGAKRPIGDDPWMNNSKRPFQGQGNGGSSGLSPYGYQGTVAMAAGWPQAPVQMGSFGYLNTGRGMGFGSMMGPMGGMPLGGLGSPPGGGYGMSEPYGTAYTPPGSMTPVGAVSNIGIGMGSPLTPPSTGHNGLLGPGITDPRANDWKLFLGQVPFNCIEQDLCLMFAELGDILELVILRVDERSKGCVFVTYADRATAELAIYRFNGQVQAPGDTRGKKLVVRFAERKKESNWTASPGHRIKSEG